MRIGLVLKDELEGDDAFMRNMAANMFTKFDKYWTEFSTIMEITGILDPCYKFQFADWAYKKIYVGIHDAQLGLLKDKLFALFDEYVKASNLASTSASSPTAHVSRNAQQAAKDEYFEVCLLSI